MLEWFVQNFGLAGWFISSFIANTILPIPFEPLLFLCYALGYDPIIWILVAGIAAVAGESTIYLATKGGRNLITKAVNWFLERIGKPKIDAKAIISERSHSWIKEWFDQWGFGTIFIGAFTPLPMFLFDIFAGYLDYPYWEFAIACFLGKLSRYTVILLGGSAMVTLFFLR